MDDEQKMTPEEQQADFKARLERAEKSPQFQTVTRKIEKAGKVWQENGDSLRKAMNEILDLDESGSQSVQAFDQRINEAGYWLGRILKDASSKAIMRIVAEQAQAEEKEPAGETVDFPTKEAADG